MVPGCEYDLRSDGLGVSVNGWELRAVKSKLSSVSELEAMPLHRYRDEGGGWGNAIDGDGEAKGGLPFALDFPMPEMIFGASILEFKHKGSGFVFHFSTLDALHHCRLDHPYQNRAQKQMAAKDGGEEGPAETIAETGQRRLLQVPGSANWARRTVAGGGGGPAVEIKAWDGNYDWSYCCPGYKGNCYGGGAQRWRVGMGTAKGEGEEGGGATGGEAGGGSKKEHAQEYAIDYERLKRRDPILWFDDIDLYESELDDNGEAKLSAKVRVMPGCFFCLQRFYLRLDKVLMRIYDTRYALSVAHPLYTRRTSYRLPSPLLTLTPALSLLIRHCQHLSRVWHGCGGGGVYAQGGHV
jgi:hypothetical protein